MPKSLVPAKKRPSQTARPTRSGSVAVSAIKKGKLKSRVAAGGAKPGNKSLGIKALGTKAEKTKVKKPAEKKDPKKKKVVVKKVKVSTKKPLSGKSKKKVSPAPKKPEKSERTEKANVKKEKDDSGTEKEPVEVVIHVKKPKAKQVPKNEPKTGVTSGKVKKAKITKATQMKKEILKKLSGKMDEKLESVVNTILEVAVVKKVHSKTKPEEHQKEKKKPKEVAKKKTKETKDVKSDPKKTDIKSEVLVPTETPEKEVEVIKEPVVVCKPEDKTEKSYVKSQMKELNDEDIRKMEIKKEIIDEFIQEEEKQSKAKLERKKLPFLKKPKLKPKELMKKEIDMSDKDDDDKAGTTSQQDEKKDENVVKDVSKPSGTSTESEKSSKKDELVKNKLKAKSTKGKKGSNTDKSDNEEKLPEDKDDDIMDEEQKAKRMKLYGFWTGPKRHRVASLNAIAKVHCLYENESRGAMNEMLDKSVSKGKIDKRKIQRKNYKESESDEKKESDDSVQEMPKRSLRTAPGMRGVGRHYDVETSSSSAPSTSSSEAETEDEKPSEKRPSPKREVKKPMEVTPKVKAAKEKKEETKEKVAEETAQGEPVKKVRKRRRRCELMMDLKDMVVRKRMASLNASAMLAATYSVEKKPLKSDDDRRKKSAQSTTTDSTQSSTEVEPESSDEEVILSGSSKKVAVIVNQDTDVTITGLYVNSTTRSTRHCSITGMQYRISSTSHTQTESTAVTTETVIHTTDHVSVSHSSSSSVEAVGSPSGSCKSYTPLGALSSMQPPGNSSPLMRRHPCSTSAFSAPPPYHHHQDMHGYYQPAGPLISHHYHAAASSSTSSLPAVSAPPAASSKGSPGPEQTSRSGDPPSEPPPPQEYRPPPFTAAGYPPPPHNYNYPYLQPPYVDCYSPYLKYPAHPGFRRGFWPGPGASSTSGGPMVTSDPYHGPPPGPGGPIEPFPHPVAQPPPQPYYYPHAAPPTCYTHPAPLRAPMFMSDPSYQTCPCPTMSSFPKNVLTGPLTGASKGSVQQQAQNSAQLSQQTTTGLSSSEQQAQQQAVQQQGLSVPAATQPASSIPNVALALSLETNNPNHGPPSPARGSAGLPPPASPALSTARNPPSWSPPNIIETEPTKDTKTREEIRPAEPSPPPPQTLVADGPPVLENQVQVAQRRPRPPKRKPSIERQVSPVVVEENEAELEKNPLSVSEPSSEVVPKRRRSVTPVRSKSEPVKPPPVSTRGQTKKPADNPLSANPEKKPKLAPTEPSKPITNGIPKPVTNAVSKPAPKIMDGALVKKVNGVAQKPATLLKNGISKKSKTICPMGVQKMLLKNCPKAQSPAVALKTAGARTKKENTKPKVIKSEPKRSGKKSACKDLMLLANPTRTHPNGLKWSNGWSWEGEGFKARVFLAGDESPVFRRCYPAMRHIEGDIIYPMDCILLKSGPRKQQLPFIAKVASLWENPDDGEMMISLLWYYRPEHTDQGRQPLQPDDEVFASRHRDTNSVACIEDKCYVLTYNEYCRYKKSCSASDFGVSMDKRRIVPQPDNYPRSRRLPSGRIANELLFFCRKVYDFRTKRLLKKPY